MKGPRIVKAGKHPGCVHHESIDGRMIGTCRKCGQIRAYGSTEFMKDGKFIIEQVQGARSRGGIASRKKPQRGSANENSAAWAGLRPRARPQLPPVLVKGVDI